MWRNLAACLGMDTEIFFPESRELETLAKKVCQDCEVRQDCLDWAVEQDEAYGIYGGMTRRERRKVR